MPATVSLLLGWKWEVSEGEEDMVRPRAQSRLEDGDEPPSSLISCPDVIVLKLTDFLGFLWMVS